jgi:hypothetical protein
LLVLNGDRRGNQGARFSDLDQGRPIRANPTPLLFSTG